jgi:transposase
MKDGRTHLAHKAEHAVDLDTGAVVAVRLREADKGDTTTLDRTLCEAGETVAELVGREAELHHEAKPKVNVQGIEEMVADKGYHSGAVLERVANYQVRSYIPERQQKGRRNWAGKASQQQAVYANRRRVQGNYGKSLLRRRGEFVERSFAHCYDTGGMRRTHLRKHNNIFKRQLVHVAGFNLSLILRKLMGAGTPREWNNLGKMLLLFLLGLFTRRRSYRPCRTMIFRSRPAATETASITPRSKSCRRFASYATGC